MSSVSQNQGSEPGDDHSKEEDIQPISLESNKRLEEIPAHANELIQTVTAVHLYSTQRDIAKFLEVAYLALNDHPDISKQVRMTAHAARTQHLMTSGLMKKFIVTAAHTVSTVIPMISDALELGDVDMIKHSFTLIIDMAEDMKKEAEETRTSYLKIQTQVQDNIAFVTDRNKYVADEQTNIKTQMETEKNLARAAKHQSDKIAREKKELDKELEKHKSNRDKFLAAIRDDGSDDDMRFLDATLANGGIIDLCKGFVYVGVKAFLRRKRNNIQMAAYKETQSNVEHTNEEKMHLLDKIYKHKQESLERFEKMKQLIAKENSLGNSESLCEAGIHLGLVDKQLVHMIMFWDNTAALLKYLRDDPKAAALYLKKIENPAYAEKFKASISRIEKVWKSFGRVCNEYVTETDTRISILYEFLSSPVDAMSTQQRKDKQQRLMDELEADINTNIPELEYDY